MRGGYLPIALTTRKPCGVSVVGTGASWLTRAATRGARSTVRHPARACGSGGVWGCGSGGFVCVRVSVVGVRIGCVGHAYVAGPEFPERGVVMADMTVVETEIYHAPDCWGDGFCGGCGWIAADGLWYPGPCPEGERQYQQQRSEGWA